MGFGVGVPPEALGVVGSGVAPSACGVAGALAAVDALAPVVGAAPEVVGDGDGLLGVGDGLLGVGEGDGDPTGGLPLAVGPGLGFWLQVGDDCGDGAGELDGAAEVPLPDVRGEGAVVDEGPPSVLPPPFCPPPLPWF